MKPPSRNSSQDSSEFKDGPDDVYSIPQQRKA